MLLSILIPTYNRSNYLVNNIKLLENYIYKNNLVDEVKLIISNNFSTDNTKNIINNLKNKSKINIDFYHQKKNIGLEKNALFVLRKARSEYVMYLGDDDYIGEEYLLGIVNKISKDKSISCIIPSFKPVDLQGAPLPGGRDLNKYPKIYNNGFHNCLENSWRGHQLSGLVFKRENLLEEYCKNDVNNIYPFIYFVAHSCLIGKTWHFTEYPVKVTQPGQDNKDWNYGKDGLIGDIFDNYIKLEKLTYIQKVLLELKFLNLHSWRYMHYYKQDKKLFFDVVINIIRHKNTLFVTKLIFPLIILKKIIRSFLGKIKRSIINQ